MQEWEERDELLEWFIKHQNYVSALIERGATPYRSEAVVTLREICRKIDFLRTGGYTTTWRWLLRYNEYVISRMLDEPCENKFSKDYLRCAVMFDTKKSLNGQKIQKILDNTADDKLLEVLSQIFPIGYSYGAPLEFELKDWCERRGVNYGIMAE